MSTSKSEIVADKNYKYWTVDEFIKDIASFERGRVSIMMVENFFNGITPQKAIKQIECKNGPAYDLFSEMTGVGGDTFFQEILVCGSLINFYGRSNVEGVAFPVKTGCPDTVEISTLEEWSESYSEYDFLLKKGGELIRVQLKSMPEKYVGKFTTKMFVDSIISETSGYNDKDMILAYLLQPSVQRADPEEYYKMIDEISNSIGSDLPVKDILLVSRRDLETYEYIQIYGQVKISNIQVKDSVQTEIRNATNV